MFLLPERKSIAIIKFVFTFQDHNDQNENHKDVAGTVNEAYTKSLPRNTNGFLNPMYTSFNGETKASDSKIQNGHNLISTTGGNKTIDNGSCLNHPQLSSSLQVDKEKAKELDTKFACKL